MMFYNDIKMYEINLLTFFEIPFFVNFEIAFWNFSSKASNNPIRQNFLI